ncbi:hypothetical protein INR49_005812 [Caranx melampygus]|nr:hypothetical protein INR49_005812 [Caranx melampygus]
MGVRLLITVIFVMLTSKTSNMRTAAQREVPSPTPDITAALLQTPISGAECGSIQFCAAEPAGCDPSSGSSCYFFAAKLQSGSTFDFSLSGQSAGYIAATLSRHEKCCFFAPQQTYLCANNSSSVAFLSALQINNMLNPKPNVDSVKGKVGGTTIQCTFAATVPRLIINSRNISLSIFTGTFDSTTGTLGTSVFQLKTQVVDLADPGTSVTNELSTTTTATPTTANTATPTTASTTASTPTTTAMTTASTQATASTTASTASTTTSIQTTTATTTASTTAPIASTSASTPSTAATTPASTPTTASTTASTASTTASSPTKTATTTASTPTTASTTASTASTIASRPNTTVTTASTTASTPTTTVTTSASTTASTSTTALTPSTTATTIASTPTTASTTVSTASTTATTPSMTAATTASTITLTAGHGITLHQSLTQVLLITVGVLGLVML